MDLLKMSSFTDIISNISSNKWTVKERVRSMESKNNIVLSVMFSTPTNKNFICNNEDVSILLKRCDCESHFTQMSSSLSGIVIINLKNIKSIKDIKNTISSV